MEEETGRRKIVECRKSNVESLMWPKKSFVLQPSAAQAFCFHRLYYIIVFSSTQFLQLSKVVEPTAEHPNDTEEFS
jgi:hypothetical protein